MIALAALVGLHQCPIRRSYGFGEPSKAGQLPRQEHLFGLTKRERPISGCSSRKTTTEKQLIESMLQ